MTNAIFFWGIAVGAMIFGPTGFLFAAIMSASGRQSDMEDDQHLYAEQRRAER